MRRAPRAMRRANPAMRRANLVRERGFTYLGLLFAIVILGITLATVGIVWSTQIRREREAELLFIGEQFRTAIGSYQRSGGLYPLALADLLEDKRMPVPKRYLRRIYADPMTGAPDWDLIMTADHRIMGVASHSAEKPIKVAGFPERYAAFEKAESYQDWRFIYLPSSAGRRRVLDRPGTRR